jgi:hypothetical protein
VTCARGIHEDQDTVAIWHVSAEGIACGAWVWPWPSAPEDARRAVGLIDGRLLVDVTPESAIDLAAELADLAGVAAPEITRPRLRRVTPGWLLSEVAGFHSQLQKAFEDAVAARSGKLVPLDLALLPEGLEGDVSTQLSALGLQRPSGVSPVAAHALGTANLVKGLIRLWREAEKQRMRRSYLRSSGDARPLSEEWLSALRDAATQPLIGRRSQ